ncbi:TIGR03620 family F420-dependent LLM class oxidoreductase [Microlunatus sp. GCM10028923]|uniref:TIGR03620 family F420-dependent LLM class oxidoreductase n=1 Tax=Microlunatus sp. GCM10028923 TaxID=3273400 RepID=UPI003619353F
MTATIAAETRSRIGRVGFGLMAPVAPADEWREAARRIDRAGYGTIWINEGIGGRDVFAQLGVLLAATDRIAVGSSVANLWARHPGAMQGGAAVLADAYPGRFLLGIGVSGPQYVEASGQTWTRPLERTRTYLEQMAASADWAPRPSVPFPRVVAALGPKMTELARDHSDGAFPAAMPVEHTRRTRELLGPDPLLITILLAVDDPDLAKARAAVRGTGMLDDAQSGYAKALRGLGYTDADLADRNSDALIDARFALGTPETIAARVQDHLDAGADQVVITAVPSATLTQSADLADRLAPALSGHLQLPVG